MRSIRVMALLGLGTLVCGGTAVRAGEACTVGATLRVRLLKAFPGWRVTRAVDLDPYHRSLFEKDHAAACPGIVQLDFFGDSLPATAFSLVKGKRSKLVLARQRTVGNWSLEILDQSDRTPVVWREERGEYSDAYGAKKLSVARDGLVWCAYESSAILYAWVDGRVQKIWIAD